MGDLADDAISGHCCSWCGIYFDGEHGYPVVCKECFQGATDDELEFLQVATILEM